MTVLGVPSGGVSDLFWLSFEKRKGAILLACQKTPQLAQFKTLTEAESFYSHEQILGHFRHRIPGEDDPEWGWVWDTDHPDFHRACAPGKRVAGMWFAKLQQDFPQYRFRVYWTRLSDLIVRYHRVRPDETVRITDESRAESIACRDLIIYDSGAHQT